MNSNVLINQTLVDKFESISQDIKVYINTNGMIYESMPNKAKESFRTIDPEDLLEISEIRKKLKRITDKLKNNL